MHYVSLSIKAQCVYVLCTMLQIGVHEMHGQVQCHVTDLFVHDPLSSSSYPMIIYTNPDNLPIKTLVARQLQTNVHTGISCVHNRCMLNT